jgi:DNA-binding protein YbaB
MTPNNTLPFILLLPLAAAAFTSSDDRRRSRGIHQKIIQRRVRGGDTSLSVSLPNWFGNKGDDSTIDETDLMQRTAKMMEDHRRSQEAMEKTSAMMEELAATLVVGESKKKGVKVTFNGQRRPVSVEVDPSFLISSSSGVISTAELNTAITDAMKNAYGQSGALMEKRMSGLYEQLGLPREPLSLDSKRDDQK